MSIWATILITVVQTVLVLLAVMSVTMTLFTERSNYRFIWEIWKRFRVIMLFEVISLFVLTLIFILVLWTIPGLKYGWMNFFFTGGGNILISPVLAGSKSEIIWIRLMVPVFFFAVMLMLPFLAKSEEVSFRQGYNNWRAVIKQSIKFGLVHCFVGIPLAAGIGLIISGFFYGYKYKRTFDRNYKQIGIELAEKEAVMVSTAYHTLYNYIVITIIFVIAVLAV